MVFGEVVRQRAICSSERLTMNAKTLGLLALPALLAGGLAACSSQPVAKSASAKTDACCGGVACVQQEKSAKKMMVASKDAAKEQCPPCPVCPEGSDCPPCPKCP